MLDIDTFLFFDVVILWGPNALFSPRPVQVTLTPCCLTFTCTKEYNTSHPWMHFVASMRMMYVWIIFLFFHSVPWGTPATLHWSEQYGHWEPSWYRNYQLPCPTSKNIYANRSVHVFWRNPAWRVILSTGQNLDARLWKVVRWSEGKGPQN